MADRDEREPDRDRIEELLRQSLETRAQDVHPDPVTWQKVSARVRRARRLRLALAGAGGMAAVVLAAVVLPNVFDRGAVDLVPPATRPPEPTETAGGDPTTGRGACGGPSHVAAVLARTGEGLAGTLWALCDDGSESHLDNQRPQGATDTNPALSWDGNSLVFERVGADGVSLLVHLDMTTGAEQVIGGGRLPAFSPDGRLAWVQPVEQGQDRILIGRPFDEPEMEFPVIDGEDGEWFDARRLAWDAAGETLYAEIGYEESVVFAYDPDTGAGRRLEEPVAEERYAGPSTAPEGLGVAVLARCCLVTDGQRFDRAELRLVDSDDARLLNQMPDGFDADGDVWTAYAPMGELRQVEGTGLTWSGGTRAAWLVGDGDGLWIVEGDGTVHPMGLKVSAAAANPALSPDGPGARPDGMAPEQEGLTDDAAVTRRRIWQAAQARDYDALGALMGPEFTASFGADSGPEAGVAELRAMAERGEDPFALVLKLLAMPYGTQEREGGPSPIHTWPSVFGKPAAEWTEQDEALLAELGDERDVQAWRQYGEYSGWRLGIDASGAWLYLVAGD